MKSPFLVMWLSLFLWFEASVARGEVRSVRIARHTSSFLTNVEADAILAEVSRILRVADGTGDVACNLTLQRNGLVTVFTHGDGAVDSEAEWEALLAAVDAEIIVVEDINHCGIYLPGAIGCAPVPGNKLVVERFTAALEGVLWTHEYGHNRGLDHRENDHAVMRSFVSPTHRWINDSERAAYEGPAPAVAAQVQAQPADAAAERVDITTFVERAYVHGVPWDEASRYTVDDIPRILRILSDGEKKAFHANAIETLGLIGNEESVETLINYVKEGKEIGKPEYVAKLTAIYHLGSIYNKTKSERAIEFLVKGVQDPETLAAGIPQTVQVSKTPAVRKKEALEAAIRGLSLTGSDRAIEVLEMIRGAETVGAAVVDEAVADARQVKEAGLLKFYELKRGHHAHHKE